jgi:hypothetical protein
VHLWLVDVFIYMHKSFAFKSYKRVAMLLVKTSQT